MSSAAGSINPQTMDITVFSDVGISLTGDNLHAESKKSSYRGTAEVLPDGTVQYRWTCGAGSGRSCFRQSGIRHSINRVEYDDEDTRRRLIFGDGVHPSDGGDVWPQRARHLIVGDWTEDFSRSSVDKQPPFQPSTTASDSQSTNKPGNVRGPPRASGSGGTRTSPLKAPVACRPGGSDIIGTLEDKAKKTEASMDGIESVECTVSSQRGQSPEV
jgi:hypothetical protein